MTPFDLLSLIIVWLCISVALGYSTRHTVFETLETNIIVLVGFGFILEIIAVIMLFILYCFYNVGMMAFN